jgi:polyisoprenoid-binding protein YceI
MLIQKVNYTNVIYMICQYFINLTVVKSADFFDVAKYPTAKFEITGVEVFVADSSSKDLKIADATHTIKDNLTLKDNTKNIAFPAKVTIGATNVTAIADFNIDRTLWVMNYKGPNNPQNWIINRAVNIKLNISSPKK